MKLTFCDYDCKGRHLAAALARAGHEFSDALYSAQAFFIDYDLRRETHIANAAGYGMKVIIYPHAGGAAWVTGWDGLHPLHPGVSEIWVQGPGHVEILKRYGFPDHIPVRVIGWTLGELRPRQIKPAPRNILFAPTHPPYHHKYYRTRNGAILRELAKGGYDRVLVRCIGEPEVNGLPLVAQKRVEYDPYDYSPTVFSDIEAQTNAVDAADAVVADASTFGSLAVARGVTTVMLDSGDCLSADRGKRTDHVAKYGDYIMHPWDPWRPQNVNEAITRAANDVIAAQEWRDKFIGGPLTLPPEWRQALDPDMEAFAQEMEAAT